MLRLTDQIANNHQVDVITDPRYEDFEIKYNNKNMWAMLGMGSSLSNVKKDFSPYLRLDQIDPKWLEAVGSPVYNTAEKHEGETK